ncbi:MAG: DEAD/DEAH box helicase, partial [Calditrichales bacterium]
MSELTKFLDLGISKAMVHELQKKGFEEPTPIQEKIIPLLLAAERDLVGKAQTGTGKTAAFGIPIIEKLKENSRHVQVLVLVPTRELAIQVSEEINSFKGKRKLSIMPIYGGQSIEQQLRKLKRGVDVVVGTPGRVQDHLNRKTLDVSKVSYLILDEADEMLNMGFLEDVEKIMAETNPERNTLLFSATMPKEIRNVAKKYMRNYELIEVEGKHVTVDLTDQIYFEVANRDKFEALCRIIDIEDEFYGLVFCRTKIDANNVMSHLQDRGYDAEALHGDISQIQRETILRKFKKRQINILVATDVAARGIDIQNLTHVINYAIPQDAEAYVHRIGRTGRAGREGTAITFITPDEYRKLMYIQKVTRTDIRKEKLPQVRDVIDIKRNRIMSEIDELVQEQPTHDFLQMAEQLLAHNRAEDAMAALLQYLFADELNPESYNEVRDVYPQIKGKTRLFVAKGKK